MEFHPDKCEVISITRKCTPAQYPYVLSGHQLKLADVVKYKYKYKFGLVERGLQIVQGR